MKTEETRGKLVELIREVEIKGLAYDEYVEALADKLTKAGVFVPPVKCGDKVYAACPKLSKCDDDIIDEYTVCGVGINDKGEVFVLDSSDEINVIGDMYCNLTREEAEMWFRKEGQDGGRE